MRLRKLLIAADFYFSRRLFDQQGLVSDALRTPVSPKRRLEAKVSKPFYVMTSRTKSGVGQNISKSNRSGVKFDFSRQKVGNQIGACVVIKSSIALF